MNIIFSVLIFCIVLFIYLHVHFHLKTSNDLELYEIELPSKTKLEEICDIRQPLVFTFNNERIMETCIRKTVLDTYGAFDIKIRNIKDQTDDSEMYIPLAFASALKLDLNFTGKLLELIHSESIRKQTDIMNDKKGA